MEVNWPIAVSLLTTFVGAVGYIAKKYLDLRLDAIARFHADKYNAVVQVRGLLSEIDHCILHLSKGDEAYAEPFEQYCMSVRRESRAKSALFGDKFIREVRDSTDVALAYLQSRTDSDRNTWGVQLKALLAVCDSMLRTVELHPRAKERTGV